MDLINDKEREEQALDALIVAAYLPGDMESDMPDFDGPTPVLSDEDQKALDNLGSDLIDVIVSGEFTSKKKKSVESLPVERKGQPELAGALNRGEDDLTEKAREEIERKIKEADEEEDEEPENKGH